MASGVGKGEAELLLAGINIPPRPTVVTGIAAERRKNEPDINRISSLIATDVALSAAMLKVVNSPLYGLSRRLSSVQHAVSVLGLDTTTKLVTGLALRKTLPAGQNLDRFWDSTAEVAMISAFLAGRMPGITRDDAYTHGLFRDCGIPILIQKFPDYRETLRIANTASGRKFTDVEDERHQTNHAIVGHLLARTWNLPDLIRDSILVHHDPEIFAKNSGVAPTVLNLVAVSHMAENISNSQLRLAADAEWERMGEPVLAHLMISEDEFEEMQKDVREMLESNV